MCTIFVDPSGSKPLARSKGRNGQRRLVRLHLSHTHTLNSEINFTLSHFFVHQIILPLFFFFILSQHSNATYRHAQDRIPPPLKTTPYFEEPYCKTPLLHSTTTTTRRK